MSRYYKPHYTEIIKGRMVECYDRTITPARWVQVTVDVVSMIQKALKEDNVRMRYVEEIDFAPMTITYTKVGERDILVDILPDGKEIFEKEDILDEENLIILKNKEAVGMFYPYAPNKDKKNNIKIYGKEYLAKNPNELKELFNSIEI